MTQIATILAFLGSNTITGVIIFVLNRPKHRAETQGIDLKNLNELMGLYKKIATDLKEEVVLLREAVDQLTEENRELKQIVSQINGNVSLNQAA